MAYQVTVSGDQAQGDSYACFFYLVDDEGVMPMQVLAKNFDNTPNVQDVIEAQKSIDAEYFTNQYLGAQ